MHSFRIRELLAEKSRMEGRRISLKDVAAATGITSQVLSKMNDPRGYVTNTGYLEALCRYFGVSPAKLIMFDPPIETLRPTTGDHHP